MNNIMLNGPDGVWRPAKCDTTGAMVVSGGVSGGGGSGTSDTTEATLMVNSGFAATAAPAPIRRTPISKTTIDKTFPFLIFYPPAEFSGASPTANG